MSKETTERFETINAKIKEAVDKTANITAVDTVVSAAVQKEVDKRAQLIEKGLEGWSKAKASLNKINRPDVVYYEPVLNKDGKDSGSEPVKVQKYSDNRMKEINKAKELIAKYDMALLKALGSDANYEKLESLVK